MTRREVSRLSSEEENLPGYSRKGLRRKSIGPSTCCPKCRTHQVASKCTWIEDPSNCPTASFRQGYNPREANSLPLKIGRVPKGILFFQPSIFRGYVTFREGIIDYFFGYFGLKWSSFKQSQRSFAEKTTAFFVWKKIRQEDRCGSFLRCTNDCSTCFWFSPKLFCWILPLANIRNHVPTCCFLSPFNGVFLLHFRCQRPPQKNDMSKTSSTSV